MSNFVELRNQHMSLCVPSEELLKISLVAELKHEKGIPFVELADERIPVYELSSDNDGVHWGSANATGKYIAIIQGKAMNEAQFYRSVALQVEQVNKHEGQDVFAVPEFLKKKESPILGVFMSPTSTPCYTTTTNNLIEYLATPATEEESYEHNHRMDG